MWRSWGRFRAPPEADEARKKEWQQLGDWRARNARDDRTLDATGSAANNCNTNLIFYRGVAQLVARDVWEQDTAPQGIPKQKTPKSLVNTDFFGTLLSRKILIISGLTTDLTTYGKTSKIQYFLPFGVWRSW